MAFAALSAAVEIVLEVRDIIAKNGYTFGRFTTTTATAFRL
jgi:hypothetical protein